MTSVSSHRREPFEAIIASVRRDIESYIANRSVAVIWNDSVVEERLFAADGIQLAHILGSVVRHAVVEGEADAIYVSFAHRAAALEGQNALAIEIIDNGSGMHEDHLHDAVTHPVPKAGGNLTYLQQAGRFAAALGGKVEAKSKIGLGSSIVLLLPETVVLQEAAYT